MNGYTKVAAVAGMVALLFGCVPTVQYTPAAGEAASAGTSGSDYPGASECASWQAVFEDPQRYSISLQQTASEIASRCGPPYSVGHSKPPVVSSGADQCANLRAVVEDRARYGIPTPPADAEALLQCNPEHLQAAPNSPAVAAAHVAPTPAPVVAGNQCPTTSQIIQILRCGSAIPNPTPADLQQCAGGLDLGVLWNCIRSDRALQHVPLSAISPQQAPTPPPQAPALPPQTTPNTASLCDPARVRAGLIAIDNQDLDPVAKGMAAQMLMQMLGCSAGPPAQLTPTPQTTTCIPLGGGMFTCTSQ